MRARIKQEISGKVVNGVFKPALSQLQQWIMLSAMDVTEQATAAMPTHEQYKAAAKELRALSTKEGWSWPEDAPEEEETEVETEDGE
jgi:hypothetical protein